MKEALWSGKPGDFRPTVPFEREGRREKLSLNDLRDAITITLK
jgi:hypothetical protein